MTVYEIVSIAVSGLAIIISIVSIWKANSTASAGIELDINRGITSTRARVSDMSIQMFPLLSKAIRTPEEERLLQGYTLAFEEAQESHLNAIEEACAKYLDKKVDRRRFKKTHRTAIRQLVEDDDHKQYLDPLTSRFKAILKVYKEWENLEK